MKVIVDRFEGDVAVCEIEKGIFANIPKILINGAAEGDVIRIEVDKTETNIIKDKMEELVDSVFEE
jgi:hypothetical protein